MMSPVGPATTTRPVFRGWFVVATSFAVLAVAYGMQFSFGVFVDPITDDTGWSTTVLSLAYALYVALYSLMSSVSGWATDRFGPRVVLVAGGAVLGAGWALLGVARSPWQVYLALGVVAAVGMSASWVPTNATVVKWFVRRRGLAVGIASTGGSVGNFVVPPIVAACIVAFGWRPTLVAMGVLGGVALVVLARWMVRSPESVGLHPDGDPAPLATATATAAAASGFTVGQARRTGTFWVIFAVFALTWLVVFVPFLHVVPFAEDLGVGSLMAAWVVSVIGIGGAAGRLLVGPGSDRLGRRTALAAMLAAQVVGFLGLAAAEGLPLLLPSAFVFGFAYGGGVTTMPGLVGDYFGRAHAGSIVGAIFALSGSLAAIGPFVAGLLYDATGSYRSSFVLSAACNLAALGLVALLRPPVQRSLEASTPSASSAPIVASS
jgi:MFS family permease